jgi:tripartite ATP-independent transporter DctP family solute receptor
MKFRMIRLALAAVAAAMMLAMPLGGPASAQQKPEIVLKLAHGATTDQAIGKGMLKFAELVNAKTNGRVKVETYLSGSLYSERTALEAMINGSVDFAGASNANWAPFTDALLFMDLPYVFNDEASFRKVLDGPVGEEIHKRFEKKGFKLLMELDNGGFRDVVNNRRPIHVPSDMKGLKFRTTASPVEIAMFKNWGGVPTAIDWAEVYNALSSGVVDGEFVMPTWLRSAKHYEVLKYQTNERAAIGIQTLAMRKDRFDKLPPDVQKAIVASAKEAQAYSNKLDGEMGKTAVEYAKKIGVKIYTPTADEMKIWRSTGRQIWKQFDGAMDKDLLKQVLDAQK